MNEFSLKAPLANDGMEPCSAIEQLALALGRMTGAMLPDGAVVDAGNNVLCNMALQAIMSDADIGSSILASAHANDDKSTFVAMLNGEVWRVEMIIYDGHLVVSGHKCGLNEVKQDCSATEEYTLGLKKLVGDALRENGLVEEGDQLNGHIKLDVHAAICERVAGSGKFIVFKGKSNVVRGGFAFVVNATRPQAEREEVLATLQVAEMSQPDIDLELEIQKKAMGIMNPFPVMVGEA